MNLLGDVCKMNGFMVPDNTNLTINIIKKIQKNPTQEKLDSAHLLRCDNASCEPIGNVHLPEKTTGADRDVNLYRQLGDFLDLLKPRELVVVQFHNSPFPIFVQYTKTTKKQCPQWLKIWMEDYPNSTIEYCTDVHGFLSIMGPLCSLINISNLLNRLESPNVNYTLILLSLTIFPKCDLSPITRNASPEHGEILKSVIYEDVHRKLRNVIKTPSEDRLFNSRTRNMFGLPALSGTNFTN